MRLAAGRGRDDDVVLDLLFASSGVEREIVEAADDMEVFEGVRGPSRIDRCPDRPQGAGAG